MRDRPGGEITAVAPAGDRQTFAIDRIALERRVERRHAVVEGGSREVADDGCAESLAVGLTASRIAIHDVNAGRSEELKLEKERLAVREVRAAMDLQHGRPRRRASTRQPPGVHAHIAMPHLEALRAADLMIVAPLLRDVGEPMPA